MTRPDHNRRRKARKSLKHKQSVPTQKTPEPEALVLGPTTDDYILVELDESGIFAVYGEKGVPLNVEFGEFIDFPLMSETVHLELDRAVEQSITGANFGLQVARGGYEARGLVRLAPETIRMLQTGSKTVQQGGWNLGSLASSNGHIVHSVRWLPAGSAGGLTIAANAAAGMALLALQWQLSRIEGLVEKNLLKTCVILQEIQEDQRNEIFAKVKRLSDAIAEARAANAVTNAVWEGVGGQEMETSLDKLARNIEQRVDRMARELRQRKGAKDRREWMNRESGTFLQDIVSLLAAIGGLYRYRALRVAHILQHPDDQDVATKVGQNALRDHEAMIEKLAPWIEELWRYFSLMIECPGGMGVSIFGRSKTTHQVSRYAQQVRDTLAEIYTQYVGPELREPEPPQSINVDLGIRLRWILKVDEQVVIEAKELYDFRQKLSVIGTNQRVLVLKRQDFVKTGLLRAEFPLSQIRITYNPESAIGVLMVKPGKGSDSRLCAFIRGLNSDGSESPHLQKLRTLQEHRKDQIRAKHPSAASPPTNT